ncbi:hypothetical protein Ddc_24824 [Ditylenchus destructor]|nr:hypothetical protein Ddc_24824 [Ditylenchus destructor]
MEVPTAIPTPVPPVTFRPPFFHWHSPFIELGGLDGPWGQAVSIISPTVPKDSDGSDFNLSVLAGPQKLSATLSSILQASKDPIIQSLKQKVGGLAYPRIRGISAHRLGGSFAAVSKQDHNASWKMDMLSYDDIDSYLKWILPSKFTIPALNSTQNKTLLEDINSKLSDALSNLGGLAKLEAMEPFNLSAIPQTPPNGIRFLDLRIYREDDGEYYNQHFLRGPKLDELLDQIGQFLEKHSSSAEFIIVELAQCYSLREHVTEVANKVNSRLAHKPLSSITKGKPKVLFVSREGACTFPHSVLNVVDDSLEKPGNGSPLLPKWFTKVPSNGEEVAHILLNTFDPDARIKNLRHRAYERNAEVSQVLGQKDTPWRYMMDWYTDCKGVEKSEDLPVERIIQANKAAYLLQDTCNEHKPKIHEITLEQLRLVDESLNWQGKLRSGVSASVVVTDNYSRR